MTRHAMVVGASVAGLLAAKVLARHFDAVTLVERDRLDPDGLAARKGVPQGNHIHLLWSGGMQALERVLPGIAADLAREGGEVFDNGRDMRWYHHGVWKLRHASGLGIHAQSRPLLERCLRRRVLQEPNVRLCDGHMLHSLLGAPGERVTGVRLQRAGSTEPSLSVEADLVVDASGRSGATLPGLASLGFAEPEEDVVGVDIGYATRIFHQPLDGRDWRAMAVYATAPRTRRLGVVFPIEGNRWIVTLVGLRGDYPRTDDERDFLAFAASLEQPDLHDAIVGALPAGPVRLIRYAAQMRRRFDRLHTHAPGLLHLGDSICSLNPLYGQGMTLCALEAGILDDCLGRHDGKPPDAALARAYYSEAGKVVDAAWMLGTASDFLYPETTGRRPPLSSLTGWYITRLLQLSGSSEVVQQRFLEVIHFARPVTSLLLPDVAARVLASTMHLPRQQARTAR